MRFFAPPQVGESVTVFEATKNVPSEINQFFNVLFTTSLRLSSCVRTHQKIVRYPNQQQRKKKLLIPRLPIKKHRRWGCTYWMEGGNEDKEIQKALSTTRIVIPSFDFFLPIQQHILNLIHKLYLGRLESCGIPVNCFLQEEYPT